MVAEQTSLRIEVVFACFSSKDVAVLVARHEVPSDDRDANNGRSCVVQSASRRERIGTARPSVVEQQHRRTCDIRGHGELLTVCCVRRHLSSARPEHLRKATVSPLRPDQQSLDGVLTRTTSG